MKTSRYAFLFTMLWHVKTARFKVGSDLLLVLVSLVLGESKTQMCGTVLFPPSRNLAIF